MTPPVTVIVVNFNSGRLARQCVESAAADLATAGAEWTAVVVDNNSTDDSLEHLHDLPRTTIVANKENVGFGRAVNQAWRIADRGSRIADSVLWVLNPDCDVVRGAFARLRDVLERHGDCAIAAPRLLNADGSVQASARGEPTAWTGLFGRHSLLSRLFPESAEARRNLPARDLVGAGVESAEVDWVMGAAMLVRADRFREVGGFDERYFLYWEDADLCRRLRNAGFTTRYVPAAEVRHPGGASAKTASRLAIRAFHDSAYRYYATHVVPSPWHPARWLAKGALTARAWWRTRRGGRGTIPGRSS